MSPNDGRGAPSVDIIDKRDFDEHRPLLREDRGVHSTGDSAVVSSPRSGHLPGPGDNGLLNDVVDGIVERDRQRMQNEIVRVLSFFLGVVSCLGAGSITTFSLYGPLFLSRLHFTQLRVNTVSIAAEIALYLPVPLLGYLCDRYTPRPLSLFAGVLFGAGYLLAAFAYRSGPPSDVGGSGWPFWVTVLAFVAIGAATCSMYIAAVTTCAKNFGRGKYKGIVLAVPIAAFGLSGMWQSQVGTYLLCERLEDGSCGDVDVFRYFVFLAILLFSIGLAGTFGLQIVNDEQYIEEAVEELERSGILNETNDILQPRRRDRRAEYGTLVVDVERPEHGTEDETISLTLSDEEREARKHQLEREEAERRRKNWVLNYETRLFLQDQTMWWLAVGFFLVTGPGEAYINNLGTIIQTLSPSSLPPGHLPPAGLPSTHVTTIALTSTIARLVTGSLSDLFAPAAAHHIFIASDRDGVDDDDADYGGDELRSPASPGAAPRFRFTLSRLAFLLPSAFLLSLGFLLLASPLTLRNPGLFHVCTALVGVGYGSAFSLVPIIISVVWGVENFGTNWGIVAMAPAAGAALWGLVYSSGYQNAIGGSISTSNSSSRGEVPFDGLCHGWKCYGYWAVGCTLSVWLAIVAWTVSWRKWNKRGVVV